MPKGLKDVKWQCFYTVTRSCDSISYIVGPDNYLLVVYDYVDRGAGSQGERVGLSTTP